MRMSTRRCRLWIPVLIVQKGARGSPVTKVRREAQRQVDAARRGEHMARDVLELIAPARKRHARQGVGCRRVNALPERSICLELDTRMLAAPDVGVRECPDIEVDLVIDGHAICEPAPANAGSA